MKTPRQTSLFDEWEREEGSRADTETASTDPKGGIPPYDPNLWHHIVRITPDGKQHWEASMDAKFSALYAMQLYYCQTHQMNFYLRPHLRGAKERLTIGKSGRTVFYKEDGDVIILAAKKGKSVLDGITGSTFEYDFHVP